MGDKIPNFTCAKPIARGVATEFIARTTRLVNARLGNRNYSRRGGPKVHFYGSVSVAGLASGCVIEVDRSKRTDFLWVPQCNIVDAYATLINSQFVIADKQTSVITKTDGTIRVSATSDDYKAPVDG